MAMALEEIAAGVVESAVGPWALVVGAGAVAVAFAARSTRPLSRVMTTGVVTADASGRIDPRQWLRSIRQGVRGLVDEARAEYEAGRHRPVLTAETAAEIVAGKARSARPNGGAVLIATEPSDQPAVLDAGRRRDARGRFVPRSPNGAAHR